MMKDSMSSTPITAVNLLFFRIMPYAASAPNSTCRPTPTTVTMMVFLKALTMGRCPNAYV